MAILRLAALVLVAACAERAPGGISEEQFWQQNAGYDVCERDSDCEIALEPCDACPIAVNGWSAAQFRRQAMEVECSGDGEGECTTNEVVACEWGRCALLESKPEPTCGPDYPYFWSACNAIADTGCGAGEKCSWVARSLDPLLVCTDCVPSGPKLEGQHCLVGPDLVDDCGGRLICMGGYCTEICDALDNTNCDADETCVEEPGYFEDAENTGTCRPACDPLAPECAPGEGCYLRTDTGRGSCLAPYSYGTQGAPCGALNDCAPGHGCLTSVCSLYCDPTASGGPSCEGELHCQAIDMLPAIGICVAE